MNTHIHHGYTETLFGFKAFFVIRPVPLCPFGERGLF